MSASSTFSSGSPSSRDRYLDVLPHSYDHQGWSVRMSGGDEPETLLGAVALLDEAIALACLHNAVLRICEDARAQMEHAGCSPRAWPESPPAELC